MFIDDNLKRGSYYHKVINQFTNFITLKLLIMYWIKPFHCSALCFRTKHLAKRLLLECSVGDDAERCVIGKLRVCQIEARFRSNL